MHYEILLKTNITRFVGDSGIQPVQPANQQRKLKFDEILKAV